MIDEEYTAVKKSFTHMFYSLDESEDEIDDILNHDSRLISSKKKSFSNFPLLLN
jgi:hypothetical protein